MRALSDPFVAVCMACAPLHCAKLIAQHAAHLQSWLGDQWPPNHLLLSSVDMPPIDSLMPGSKLICIDPRTTTHWSKHTAESTAVII